MRSTLIGLFLALSTLPTAAGTPIPEWGADERCNMSFRGDANRLGRGYCLTGEQAAYDALPSIWSSVDERTKSLCIAGAGKAPSANYHLLLRCLEPYIGVEQLKNAPPFRR